ncbi:hypothetical protein [Natribacillus halophilus]|uniref:Uncharacterized protein n=1 Tax=Natribacillus halophilus TaxID=549003 RepID=A0A1G8NVJ2_9BACI|nr:hypothetical protein [Natribacillus halophilus]SDI84237.1 hypothetical protein SAMN04488123_10758 [Natribacillus halophilus]
MLMLEMLADMEWIYVMFILSGLVVISFHCHLLHTWPVHWMAGDGEQQPTNSELVLQPEPMCLAPRIQQKIPALQDRSHDDDDDETSFPPYFT